MLAIGMAELIMRKFAGFAVLIVLRCFCDFLKSVNRRFFSSYPKSYRSSEWFGTVIA